MTPTQAEIDLARSISASRHEEIAKILADARSQGIMEGLALAAKIAYETLGMMSCSCHRRFEENIRAQIDKEKQANQ